VLVDQEAKEAAKIAARRAARAAIKAKHAAEEAAKNKVPSLLHLVLDGTVSVPPSSAVSTPADGSERSGKFLTVFDDNLANEHRLGSPTTPAVDTPAEADDTGSPAVIEVNGEGAAIEQEEKYHPISLNDNTTAANYDPTADREKDRLREESKAKEEGQAKERRKVKKDFDMFADSDDDDEMSGSDTPTNAQSSSPGPSKPLQLDASLLSNWDDPEGYYKIRPHELLDSRYEVIEQLGKGTFAEVVRAKDIETEETVAIKIVRNNDTM
jgi:serine/threonine-protein kinase PRP4